MKEGQQPHTAIIGCADSRAPLETVFDAMPGDLFVLRNAGNTLRLGRRMSMCATDIQYYIHTLNMLFYNRHIYILYMLPCSVLTSAPHGMVPPDPRPGHNVPPLGYSRCLPFIFAFIPALSQIPCTYHAIQHRLQTLRLHQAAFTPIHTHHRSTWGAGGNP